MTLVVKLFSASSIFALALSSAQSMAQVADVGAGDPGGSAAAAAGDIIVTAQKRSQRLTDVGATVAVADSEQIQTAGVTDISQLSRIVPGLTAANSQLGYPVYSIRGVNFNASQLSAQPAVSVYTDEAPVPYSFMTAGMLFDVERVEVLKGPQGTLFGQNATGGSINVIVAKPTREPSAGLRGEVNNYGQVTLEGFASGALAPNLLIRAAATTTQFGAWQRGYFLSRERNGDQNRLGGRIILDWRPTDRLRATLTAEGRYDRGEVQLPQLNSVIIAVPANAPPGLATYPLPNDGRDAETDLTDTHARNHVVQVVGRLEYELSPAVNLTSITNFITARNNAPNDIDGTAVSKHIYIARGGAETFSQEIRLTGKALQGKFNTVIGANYQNDRLEDNIDISLINNSGFPQNTRLTSGFKPRNKSFGIFANADFEIVPRLTLTAGMRYTELKHSISGCTRGDANTTGLFSFLASLSGGPGVISSYVQGGCIIINDIGRAPSYLATGIDSEFRESNVSWRAGVNFKPTHDSLVYILVSRGYKAGLYPVQGAVFATQENAVRQERLTSYEVGVKASIFGDKAQIGLSAFHYDYADKQFNTFQATPIGVVNAIVNIPNSTVNGFDADITIRPFSGFTLRGAGTYINTKVGEFRSFNNAGLIVNYEGTKFNFAPAFSATLDAEYKASLSERSSIFIGAGLLHNSSTFADLGEVASTKLPSYTVLNARVGVESESGWEFSIWARNLTNEYYWTSVGPGGDTQFRFAGMPRTFGVSARVAF